MENPENNNLNTEQDGEIAFENSQAAQSAAVASGNVQEPQQSFQPNVVPPVYTNQYPPQYSPNTYSAPYYTAPTAPYNQNYVQVQPRCTQSPAEIYRDAQQGNAPQYHYGAPMGNPGFNSAYYEEQREKQLQRKKAEKKIRNIGNLSGALLIACMIVAFFFLHLILFPSVYDFYSSSLSGRSFINMIYTLVVVGGTFFVFGKVFNQHAKQQALENGGVDVYSFKMKLSAPKNPVKTVLLIIISFGGCMLANYISSILLTILETVGLHSTYSSLEEPKSAADLILMCISVMIIPALIEEFALRGVLMSNLRRYGNGFAIFASAFAFGIFHGDAAQIPFAFVCGLFFAYAVIATDSLWTGIIIHALNNSLSCISSVITQVADEETANIFFYSVSIGGIVLAVICLFIYIYMFKNSIIKQSAPSYDGSTTQMFAAVLASPVSAEDDGVLKYKGDANILTTSQKILKFITSPLMIVAIVLYLFQALTTLVPKA